MNMNFDYDRNFDTFDEVIDQVCSTDDFSLDPPTPFADYASPSSASSYKSRGGSVGGGGGRNSNSNNGYSKHGTIKNNTIINNINNNNNKGNDKSGWLGRQIAAAYDEHASIIKTLRDELQQSKDREQALVQEFSVKFEQMQHEMRQEMHHGNSHSDGNNDNGNRDRNRNNAQYHQQQHAPGPTLPFDEEDMPMDEMADTARMERNARHVEIQEQKSIMEKFKKQSNQQIHLMRKQSEEQIQRIELQLKNKVQEIDLLKREACYIAKERNFYKKQSINQSVSQSQSQTVSQNQSPRLSQNGKHLSSPTTPSMDDTEGTTDDSIPIHSFMLNNHRSPSPLQVPLTATNTMISNKRALSSSSSPLPSTTEIIDLRKPIPFTPLSKSNLTPMSRIRKEKSTATLRTRAVSHSPPSPSPQERRRIGHNFETSVLAIDGSAFEENDDGINMMKISPQSNAMSNSTYASSNSSPASNSNINININSPELSYGSPTLPSPESSSGSPSSPQCSLSSPKSTPLPTPRQLEPSGQHLSYTYHIMQRLTHIVDVKLKRSKKKKKNLTSPNTTSTDSTITTETNTNTDNNINDDLELDEEELNFLQTIEKIFHSNSKKEKKAITQLTTQLQESIKEIQDGASKSSQMNKKLQDQEEQIKYLENQLNSAHASIRSTSDLEGVLKMVVNDRKADDHAENELKERVEDLERERDELRKERDESQEETAASLSAIQRVMADVTSSKDKEIEELQMKVEDLKKQNKLWRHKYDPASSDRSVVSPVIIDQCELKRLRIEAKENIKLQKEIVQATTEMEELKSQNKNMNESMKQYKETINNNVNESDENAARLNDDLENLRKKNDELQNLLKQSEDAAEKKLEDVKERAQLELTEHSKTVSVLLKDKEKMENNLIEMTKQSETHKEEMKSVEEVLKAAKVAHQREQKLEDELNDLRNLLDGTMKNKTLLKKDLKSKDEQLANTNKEFQRKLTDLQSKIISMKEEKLELKTNLRKAEEASKRTARVLAVLQETGEMEDSAPQIVLDMKDHLREQHNIANELRQTCNEGSHHVVDKLSDGINTTLCLLEAVIFGKAIFNPKSVSDIAPWNESSAMAILEAQKKSMRDEVEDEIKSEREQEIILLTSQLTHLKQKNEEYGVILSKKEEEMNVLRSSLRETSVGYISGDDSDIDDDDEIVTTSIPLHFQHSNLDSEKTQEIVKAKEKAEAEAKDNAERLANAKMIISSLELSNKSMTEDLKSRLHDSNAAIVSLLDQSGKQEKESAELKSELEKLRSEKAAVESQLQSMNRQTFQSLSAVEKSGNIPNIDTSIDKQLVSDILAEKDSGECKDNATLKDESIIEGDEVVPEKNE